NNALKIKVMHQDRVSIELPQEAELLLGKPEVEIGYLQGYYNGQRAYGGPAQSAKRVQFLVKAQAGTSVKIVLRSQKGGRTEKTVVLE
ncbi:MAG: hypothetical protein ACM3ZQ_01765, partial [Bacillota bacterium]